MQNYTNIPIALIQYAVSEHCLPALKLYTWLKMSCSGQRVISTDDKISIAQSLGYKNRKSVDNQLRKLLSMNWIGYNTDTNIYYIRGYQFIQKIIKAKTAVRVNCSANELKRSNFRGFVGGVIFGYFAYLQLINNRYKRKNRSRKNVPVYEKGCTKQGAKFSTYYEVANIVVAKALNIASSTACSFKRKAYSKGYLSIKKSYSSISITKMDRAWYEKTQSDYDRPNNVRFVNGHYKLQQVDKILAKLQFVASRRQKQSKC